ncbi:hypothetical protein EJB05_12877, partial [Eragrostis curvula]
MGEWMEVDRGAVPATFTFSNKCQEAIYPGVLTNSGKPGFPTTGFRLQPGASASYDAPATWSGRIWARHHCTVDASGRLSCSSGDCGTGKPECNGAVGKPPCTLAEFTLGDNGGLDYYDISNVDGFNVPIQIRSRGAGCTTVTCGSDINAACPPELAETAADGRRVGCKSACLAFNADEFCCRGSYGNPNTCRPSRYSQFFKDNCPQAYSYAFDDKSSTYTCSGASYDIVFCP